MRWCVAYPDPLIAPSALVAVPAAYAGARARLPKGLGNNTERQIKIPPHCAQQIIGRAVETAISATAGAATVKPCANSIRALTSSIDIEKLGDRKPK